MFINYLANALRKASKKILPKSVVYCCALSFFFFASIVHSETKLPKTIAAAFKDNGFPTTGVGLYIQAVDAKKPLVSFQSKQPLNPASVIKVVTTAASLDMLGPGYRWTTEVYYTGKLSNNTLNGDLYFHGKGDPYLTPERFWLLLNRIKIFGIHAITGNVYFDNTYFDPEPVDYNAFDEQPYRTYHVGPNALLVGFQATEFHFSPGTSGNNKVDITPFPSSPRLKINNNVKLVNGRCGAWQKRLSLDTKTVKGVLNINFSGRYARSCDKRILYRRVTEADDHFQHYFLPLWEQLGGQFSGSIEKRNLPKDTSLVVSEASISLAEVVRFINKFSNNVMTRQLLLTLGANTFEPPGTTEKGINAIKQWLGKHNLNSKSLKLDNGAGLSRDTRISAAMLGKLLTFVYKQSYMPEFMASLPVTGNDGAMAYRFKNGPLTGRAHIKTGLLDFVQSMAGYVTTAAGKRYVVVLLHNHPRAHTKAAEKLQNDIIQWTFNQD